MSFFLVKMPPWNLAALQDVVRVEDPQKALFVVRSFPGDERKGMACSVKKESGGVYLVTCKDVANPEDIGRNDGKSLVADRFCTRYPNHKNKHRIKIQDIRNDDEFSFIPLSQSSVSVSTFQLYEDGNGTFARSCYSLAVIDNKRSEQIEWVYDNVKKRHVIKTDDELGNTTKISLGSPVLGTVGNRTFVVGVVGLDSDFQFLPIFFERNTHKIPGKKD